MKLLANFKGFLNTVRAKFFFIGGREMFDADLAGIADRDSFYSSVFNDVIYIDSFFKDRSNDNSSNKGGITQMTEAYLCNIILNNLTDNSEKKEDDKDERKFSLTKLFESLNYNSDDKLLNQFSLCFGILKDNNFTFSLTQNELKKQAYKLIFVLQNYIIYLAYRSNGTPKKLASLTEQIIVKGPKENIEYFFRNNIVCNAKRHKV